MPPAQKIMGEKVAGAIGGHYLGVPLIEECEGAPGRAGIDRLPQPIEDENRLIEQCIHDLAVSVNLQLSAQREGCQWSRWGNPLSPCGSLFKEPSPLRKKRKGGLIFVTNVYRYHFPISIVMMRPLLFLLLLCGIMTSLIAADPSEQFLTAYQTFQEGEKSERGGNTSDALKKYRFAESLLLEIAKNDPSWQKAVVEYRLKKTRESLDRVQGGSSQGGVAVAPNQDSSGGSPSEGVHNPDSGVSIGPSITIVPPSSSPGRSPKAGADTSGELRRLRSQIDDLKGRLTESQEALKSQKNRAKDLENAEWVTMRSKLENDLDVASRTISDLKRDLKARSSWEKDIKDLQKRLDAAVADKLATEEQFSERERKSTEATAALTKQLQDAQQKLVEGADARKKYEQLGNDVEKGREALDQLKAKLENSETAAKEGATKNTELQKQLTQAMEKLAVAQKQSTDISTLREKLKGLEATSVVQKDETRVANEKVLILEQASQKLKKESAGREATLRSDLQVLEEERQKIAAKAAGLAELAKDAGKVSGLEADSQSLKKTIALLQDRITSADKELLKERAAAAISANAAKVSAEKMVATRSALEADRSTLEEERQRLTAKLDQAAKAIADLGKQAAAMAPLSKEVEQLKAQLAENAKAFELSKSQLAESQKSAAQDKSTSESSLKKLLAAKDQISKDAAEIEANRSTLEEERQRLTAKLDQAAKAIADLGKQAAATAPLSKEVEQLKSQLAENAKALEQSKAQLVAAANASNADRAEAQRKFDVSKGLKEMMEKQNASLQEQLISTLGKMASLVDHGQDISGFQDQVKKLQQQLDLNTKNYVESQRQMTEIAKARPDQEKALQEKENALAEAKGDAAKLRLDLLAANKKVSELQQQGTQGNDRLRQLEEQLAEFSKSTPEREKTVAAAQLEAEKLRADLNVSKEKFAALQGKESMSSDHRKELQDQLSSKESELARLKKRKGKSYADEKTTEENVILREIVLREVKEEAKRAQARRLMDEELKRLNVQSQSLTDQITVLSSPTVRLTPQERALFKEGQLAVSEEGTEKLQVSVSAPIAGDQVTGNMAKATNQAEAPSAGESSAGASNAPTSDIAWQGKFKECLSRAKEEFDRQDYLQAENTFKEALKLAPDDYFALSNLGVVEFQLGKMKEAEETLLKAVDHSSDSSFALTTLGIVHYRQERMGDAEKILRKAVSINPQDFTAHNYLGIVLAASGKGKAGESEIMKAIEINPQYADAHFNLAVIYATSKPAAKMMAKKHYAKAIELGAPPDASLERIFQ